MQHEHYFTLIYVLVALHVQGSQVPQLIRSLQEAQFEAQQLNQQLQEEIYLREDLERELEDTAAAAKELWESMQAVYSEAADSRANSVAGSPQSEQEEWGTPERVASPIEGLTDSLYGLSRQVEPSIAEAAAAALARSAETGTNSSCNTSTTTAGLPSAESNTLNKEVLAAVEAASVQNPAAHGILTPLENKLQSLSNKLVVSMKEQGRTGAALPVLAELNIMSATQQYSVSLTITCRPVRPIICCCPCITLTRLMPRVGLRSCSRL